jgi:hypothetical protein
MDAVLDMATQCPHLEIQSTIEVAESMKMSSDTIRGSDPNRIENVWTKEETIR